jgi:hypothetical protein
MPHTMAFSRLGLAVGLGVWLCTQLTAPVAAQERVRAKVGVEVRSGEHSAPAKATETIKAGDFLRVYVVPEDDAYIYVVHNDGKTPTLLNAQEAHTKTPKGSLVILPTPETFYQIDGTSPKESITVICSPTVIPEVTTLFRTTSVPQQSWTALEKELLDKSRIDLSQKADKPFQIAGNVRALPSNAFLDHLQVSSGKTFVVKHYDFQVQK